MTDPILTAYGLNPGKCTVELLGSGLINKTWKITSGPQQFILQRINDHVFKKPREIAENIHLLKGYLDRHFPDYLFVAPVTNNNGQDIVFVPDAGYFRLFPYIQNSHTIDVVSSPDQAFEAAHQFGTFTHNLEGFDASRLHTTLPDFHNLSFRYNQFQQALAQGNPERIRRAEPLIASIKERTHILDRYEKIKTNPAIKKRVTHHDTKISNVLFDDQDKGICVIDLDTVMPGYFISDLGDMMRTYLSPANEEEKDVEKIEVREEYFRAIVEGYLKNLHHDFHEEEHALMLYAGPFMIYMQAIRFLADYCNNDIYYGARYEDHNLIRAANQVSLLQKLEAKETLLNTILNNLKSKPHFFGM